MSSGHTYWNHSQFPIQILARRKDSPLDELGSTTTYLVGPGQGIDIAILGLFPHRPEKLRCPTCSKDGMYSIEAADHAQVCAFLRDAGDTDAG